MEWIPATTLPLTPVEYSKARIGVCLAGMAAEALDVGAKAGQGAFGDMEMATAHAFAIVASQRLRNGEHEVRIVDPAAHVAKLRTQLDAQATMEGRRYTRTAAEEQFEATMLNILGEEYVHTKAGLLANEPSLRKVGLLLVAFQGQVLIFFIFSSWQRSSSRRAR